MRSEKDHVEPTSHIFEAKTITSNQQIIYSKRKRSLRPKKSYIRSENDHFEPKSHIFEAKAITSNQKVIYSKRKRSLRTKKSYVRSENDYFEPKSNDLMVFVDTKYMNCRPHDLLWNPELRKRGRNICNKDETNIWNRSPKGEGAAAGRPPLWGGGRRPPLFHILFIYFAYISTPFS